MQSDFERYYIIFDTIIPLGPSSLFACYNDRRVQRRMRNPAYNIMPITVYPIHWGPRRVGCLWRFCSYLATQETARSIWYWIIAEKRFPFTTWLFYTQQSNLDFVVSMFRPNTVLTPKILNKRSVLFILMGKWDI